MPNKPIDKAQTADIERVAGILSSDANDAAILKSYAVRLLEESDNWTEVELGAALASYLDGYRDGAAQKGADS